MTMTREEAISNVKMILDGATETDEAICYVTSNDAETINMAIEALKGIKDEKGYWTGYDGQYCSVCKLPWNYYMTGNGDDWGYFDPMPKFCPNCGAKMRSDEDD